MTFNLFSELSYDVFSPATFIFNIHAASSVSQRIIAETFKITPDLSFQEFELKSGVARFIKFKVAPETSFTITYQAQVEVHQKLVKEETLLQSIPIIELDTEVLPFLLPSRHCQSDKLTKLATNEFGNISGNYEKVLAINDWIFNNIDYISGTTDSGTSAYDSLTQREGVCKDFAHLGIALCRALDIPARYFTGYAYQLSPPDFHACFEAYIGREWIIFDPTHLVPLNAMVKIAHGKDATEAAVASFFGNSNCTGMNIKCEAVGSEFIPFVQSANKMEALSYS